MSPNAKYIASTLPPSAWTPWVSRRSAAKWKRCLAFGDTDVYVIVDLPDAATATALSLTVGASGAVRCTTTPLITAEEVDEAAKKRSPTARPGRELDTDFPNG